MRKIAILMLFVAGTLAAQDGGVYIPKVYSDGEGGRLNYNIMFPHDFEATSAKKYPLLFFMHGAGERGSDNKAQLVHGSKLFQDSLVSYPAIIVFPQCPREDYWVNLESKGKGKERGMKVISDEGPNPSMKMVLELIDKMLGENYIDPSRFYVAGLSMGGMATLELGWRIPEKIAAAIAICGVGATENAPLMVSIPFWLVHGTADNVVPSRYSQEMAKALQANGGEAWLTLYPDVGHNSWDRVFADPEFFSFLFSKSK